MSDFKIEQGIPVPPKRYCKFIYPVEEMGIGDSIFTPTQNLDSTDAMIKSRVYTLVQSYRRRWPDREFAVRSVDGGIRFWRTK